MSLGERIKKVRKERKMTLVDLAGDEITKGMLSLIENDKSKPSMETLGYLADKLEVSIGFLTQQGDEEWTQKVLENEVFYDAFNFPTDYIEQDILPNSDKIAESQAGMELYNILRVYYRYHGLNDEAENITKKVTGYYNNIGLGHLAMLDHLNDALSMIYSNDYQEAYEKIIRLEEDIEYFKEFDPDLELYYSFWRFTFALDIDVEDFLVFGDKTMELSHELENYKHYYTLNIILGYYHGLSENSSDYERYQNNIKEYLKFNTKHRYKMDRYTEEHPIQLYFILVEDRQFHIDALINMRRMAVESHDIFKSDYNHAKFYIPLYELEIEYHKKNYQYVIENYREDMYVRPQAQFPADRILMAIRSLIYPLSMYNMGDKETAKDEFLKIEATIADITHSIFVKEFYMIKDIIFEHGPG